MQIKSKTQKLTKYGWGSAGIEAGGFQSGTGTAGVYFTGELNMVRKCTSVSLLLPSIF